MVAAKNSCCSTIFVSVPCPWLRHVCFSSAFCFISTSRCLRILARSSSCGCVEKKKRNGGESWGESWGERWGERGGERWRERHTHAHGPRGSTLKNAGEHAEEHTGAVCACTVRGGTGVCGLECVRVGVCEAGCWWRCAAGDAPPPPPAMRRRRGAARAWRCVCETIAECVGQKHREVLHALHLVVDGGLDLAHGVGHHHVHHLLLHDPLGVCGAASARWAIEW